LSFKFWERASSRGRRIGFVLILFLFAILVTVAGILTPMSAQQIKDESSQLNQTQQEILKMDLLSRTGAIFLNNFEICLIMFIPILGLVFGAITLFNTGSVLAAETITDNAGRAMQVPALLVFAALFLFPFTWLEFISYSTALSEGFWLIRRGSQGELRREVKNLGKLILFTAVLLVAGAFIEAFLLGAVS
jgi:hypothetical protein